MSEHYGHSKRKSYRSLKREESKSRHKHHKDDPRRSEIEPKTPPLPTRRTSIDELIRQRETLKKELKKMAKHSDSSLGGKYKLSRSIKEYDNSKDDYIKVLQSRKRHISDQDNSIIENKKQTVKESSPEHNGDYAQIESEDEESIIEKRRQKRKQLIEKLSITQEERHIGGIESGFDQQKIENAITNQIKNFTHETTDMFSEKDEFAEKSSCDHVTQDNVKKNSELTDNWDDSEGYYHVRVGDEIDNSRYTIKNILGQGVFANVVRAQDSSLGNVEVAIKIVRNNDLMYKTGLKEITFLKEISDADPDSKYHCVKYYRYFMHKGHLCIVIESLYMDLRSVLKKYGKHHGLNMKALVSYSRQLLVALRHLKKLGIVHADIKPDNILVNEKKNVLKLCDFGSASKVEDHEPTPYLVSRFYRAPEIILGIPYKHSVDIWSAACTIYEMATGKIMFTGSSNNKMLKCFMDLKGKFPTKIIRKGKFKDQHFNYNNNFLHHKKDEFTGREKVVEVSNITVCRDLQKDLKKSCKSLNEAEQKKLVQLKDILDKMLTLDLNHRLSVTDCLKHPFIQEDIRK